MTSSHPPPSDQEENDDPPWQLALFGVVLLGVAAYFYWATSRMEEGGGSIRVPAVIALAYNVGGKWLVTSILGLGGVALLGFAGFDFMKKKS
jgi:hypothetical protein